MSRPRKPTAHLKLIGAFDKNPQRKRGAEPVCDAAVGSAPERLSEQAVEAWDYLVDSVSEVPGVLTRMDRAYLELCAIGLASVWFWNDAAKGKGSDPIPQSLLKEVGIMLGRLGMTPTDRSRVIVPKGPGGDGGQRRTR